MCEVYILVGGHKKIKGGGYISIIFKININSKKAHTQKTVKQFAFLKREEQIGFLVKIIFLYLN